MPFASYIAVAVLLGLTSFIGHLNGFSTYQPDVVDAYVVAIIILVRLGSIRYPLPSIIGTPLEASALIAYAVSGSLTLSYAVQIFNNPLQDAALRQFDHAVGFDYPAFISWISGQDMIFLVVGRVYKWFFPLCIALIACGLLFYRERQIAGRFYTAFVVAVILTCMISALAPAQGEVIHLDPQMAALVSGASPLRHLDLLRSGLMHKLPNDHGGIISFPSMRVGLGLLLLYYARQTRLLYAFAIPAVVLILSAFTHGAHYLVDGLAAVLVIVIACIFSHLAFAWTQRGETILAKQIAGLTRREAPVPESLRSSAACSM